MGEAWALAHGSKLYCTTKVGSEASRDAKRKKKGTKAYKIM
jgi:hypothetical protein